MQRTDYLNVIFQVFRDVTPVFSSGIVTLVVWSFVLFGIHTYFSLSPGVFSVGATVFQDGHLHRLFIYPFYHRTFAQLLLNLTALVFLNGSLEKGVGTVRFLSLFMVMSISTGLCYSFVDLLQNDSRQRHVEGLVPVVLGCVALTTMHTKMTNAFLCGVSFPTMALPWVFLIITTAVFPHTALPCNVIAILIGWIHGKGWLSCLDMSEARAGILEKTVPFRFLRRISHVMFIPASIEERRKTLLPQINPTPGSYPVQAYAPLTNIDTPGTAAIMYEGWPNSTSAPSGPTSSLHPHGHGSAHGFGLNHDHSCNHSHHPPSYSHR
ncbi:Rhomboid domain-containing protein 2 Rhomboid-like protein 7 [Channa argus]|uniref:Rhomboid domain-containing protein 2 Rhomboid-like protein 7 n=1 Tax=Channa argus TaxID=215402 RepID=A0A6G1PBK7_CHAAH|nr:Rhomboid domain-containing protein 2 Rhomboid-like protein 7 [Channa argus]KAK2919038.1 hypothetical protein Q8A73_003409 [Channa argus]